MLPDQIHPNGEGQKIIAERIAKELRRCLPAVFK
jgi:lysophospholipase L1-like esterase